MILEWEEASSLVFGMWSLDNAQHCLLCRTYLGPRLPMSYVGQAVFDMTNAILLMCRLVCCTTCYFFVGYHDVTVSLF